MFLHVEMDAHGYRDFFFIATIHNCFYLVVDGSSFRFLLLLIFNFNLVAVTRKPICKSTKEKKEYNFFLSLQTVPVTNGYTKHNL